jgi:tRNA pseudouridine38-40 synthase
MPRYKLTIEYDGSRFNGWQRQQSHPSVQEYIEQALKDMLNQAALVEGAGRTDAGVHALGQVAHVDLLHPLPSYKLCDGLNAYLRHTGVVILQAEQVPSHFHARFSALKRIYEFRILNRRAPPTLEANHVWHVIGRLDIEMMKAAAHRLVGHHDFTSFRATQCQAPSPVKTLDIFEIVQSGDYITAQVASRSFLHNQVRIMMGTIKLVGEGLLKADDIPTILEARDRRASGPTAPPQGLYLKQIIYK